MAIEVPNEFAPGEGEAAVLSTAGGPRWLVLDRGVRITSDRTNQRHTHELEALGRLHPEGKNGWRDGGFDFGPIFCAEPFRNVRIVRAVIEAQDWPEMINGLVGGTASALSCRANIKTTGSTSTLFIGSDGASDPHLVVEGARRPVRGVVLKLAPVTMPATDGIWSLSTPPYLQPGPDLGAMSRHRNMANWAEPLIGIGWPAGKIPPPQSFVVGKTQASAWIVRIKPHSEDEDSLVVEVGWDETRIDPLGCSLLGRSELDGLPLLVRGVRSATTRATVRRREPGNDVYGRGDLSESLPHGPEPAAGW